MTSTHNCAAHNPSAGYVCEAMTFNQLFRLTDQGRRDRAQTVRGPALELFPGANSESYFFNYKSYPSTTGSRHRGYVRFLRGNGTRRRPLQNVNCVCDCDCQDFRYRWAWANKQRGAGKVGPGSLNGAHNRAPRQTNPGGRPSLCKHLARVADYVYGIFAKWEGEAEPDADQFLNRLVTRAPRVLPGGPEGEEDTQQRRKDRQRGQDPDAPETPDVPDAPAPGDGVGKSSAGAPPDMNADAPRPGRVNQLMTPLVNFMPAELRGESVSRRMNALTLVEAELDSLNSAANANATADKPEGEVLTLLTQIRDGIMKLVSTEDDVADADIESDDAEQPKKVATPDLVPSIPEA
jgi:hypothetical protein